MQKTGTKPIPTAAFERHFTIPELSKLWSIDPGAVRHMFKDEPIVVRFQTAPKGDKRSSTTYSIPESTALRIYLCHTGASGDDAAPTDSNAGPAVDRVAKRVRRCDSPAEGDAGDPESEQGANAVPIQPISAIHTKAKKLRIVSGDNPASLADVPEAKPVRQKFALSAEQVRTVLSMLKEPVRTMTLSAVLPSMNVSELCGLRWKHVNLTPEWATMDGDGLPPFTLAVRQHFSRGEVGTLKTGSRKRNVPLPDVLVQSLAGLKSRPHFVGPDDAVFCSRRGTPVDQNNVRRRVLAVIGKTLNLTRLSWHIFRYSHATFTESIGMHARDRQALMGHGALDQTDRYTMEDLKRMPAGLDKIAGMITGEVETVQ